MTTATTLDTPLSNSDKILILHDTFNEIVDINIESMSNNASVIEAYLIKLKNYIIMLQSLSTEDREKFHNMVNFTRILKKNGANT